MKLYFPGTDLDETELGGNFRTRNPRRIYAGLTLDTRVAEEEEVFEECETGCCTESTCAFPESKCGCDRRKTEKEAHSGEPMRRGIQME